MTEQEQTFSNLQAARIDALNALDEAGERCHAVNQPNTDVSSEEVGAVYRAWYAAKLRADEAEAALSAELTVQRIEYEASLREAVLDCAG